MSIHQFQDVSTLRSRGHSVDHKALGEAAPGLEISIEAVLGDLEAAEQVLWQLIHSLRVMIYHASCVLSRTLTRIWASEF